jgi:disulfide bond formation protein DsbB
MTTSEITDIVSLALAILAVMLQALLAGLLLLALSALVSSRARRILVEARETLLGGELWAAFAIALVATLGSLYYSEIADFIPCKLCWLQRIGMYPLVALLLFSAIRRDVRGGAIYALPLAIGGALVAIYHIYIELNPSAEPASCKTGASCTVKWIDELGYITIPVLSLTAFAAVIALTLLALSRTRTAPTGPARP